MTNIRPLFAKFAPGATARPVSPRSSIATLNPSGVPGGRGDAVPACIPAMFAPPAERMAADVGASAGLATPSAGPAQPLTHAQNRGI